MAAIYTFDIFTPQLPKLRVAGSSPVCRSNRKSLKIRQLHLVYNA